MGMYTDLVLGVDLRIDTPAEVINILKYMVNGDELTDYDSYLPEHPLFKTKRWSIIPVCDSAYFGGSTVSKLQKPRYTGDLWSLSIRSNLKNYNLEIELFLNWLEPYVKTRGFVGYMRYEEFDDPTLIYIDDCVRLFNIDVTYDGRYGDGYKLDDEWLISISR